MKNALSIAFAIIAILATFMLQMGEDEQNMSLISLLMTIIIMTGVFLVDIQKVFALSNLTCNLIIILIVLVHLEILRSSPMEFIAFSIANILVYIQAVLFFKKKDFRGRIHLLTLSFILACVSTVSRQDLLFAFFMVLYFLAFVCAVALLFLDQERTYYETHAFARPPFGRDKSDKNKAPFHFIRLILGTIFLTPFFLLFGYRKDRSDNHYSDALNPMDGRRSFWSLDQQNRARDRIFGFWESAETDLVYSAPVMNTLRLGKDDPKKRSNSFYLLRCGPIFSGASRIDEKFPFSFELVRQILFAIFCCFVFALMIFLFFPRFQRLEFYGFRIGHDRWQARDSIVRSSVGFNDSIYLGELGPMFDNHESVLKVNLKDANKEIAYNIPPSEYLYLRGATLVHYRNRQWSRIADYVGLKIKQREELPFYMEPTQIFRSKERAFRLGLFDQKNDLVRAKITALPNNTGILFAFWPFFRIRDDFDNGIFDGERFINESNNHSGKKIYHLYTNIFKDGIQQKLIPNQEAFGDLDQYLGLNEKALPGLIALAKKWDKQSGLLPSDYLGRSRYLSLQLRESGAFQYSRKSIERNRDLDPLEDFIMEHRSGHCEYFAGALAMMLRAVGIPSRIVIGFKYLHDPGSGGDVSVRQSDAHSWVEAYIPGEAIKKDGISDPDPSSNDSLHYHSWWNHGAWLRLDATPYSEGAIMDTVSRNYYTWTGFLKDFWHTYILNFNSSRQRSNVYGPLTDLIRQEKQRLLNKNFWVNIVPALKEQFDLFVSSLKSGRWNMENFMGFAVPLSIILLFAGGFFYSIRVWARRYVQRSRKREEELFFMSSVYGKLEHYFAQWGIRRNVSETSREFVLRGIQEEKFNDALLDEYKKINLDPEREARKEDLEKIRNDFRIRGLETVREWYQLRFSAPKKSAQDR